jgi:ABC transport system ATP-binding/permease protein
MNIISVDSVSKTLKDAPLFEGISFGIDSGDRIGLVGRNGCGKTTLLKLISGAMAPDSGAISRSKGISVSTLEQNPLFSPDMSLRDFLLLGDAPLIRLAADYEACLADHSGAAHDRLSGLSRRMEEEGGFILERTYESLLTELGIQDMSARMRTLSGGMMKKAAIARCLAPNADIVLMDEPTNHLDIETIEWVEERLAAAARAFIVVTHDRYFLEAACTTIMEIDRSRVFAYPGDYASFLERREERYEAMEKSDARRISILRDELEWLKRGPKARGGKSRSRKQRIQEMRDGALEREEGMNGFSSGFVRQGKKILELKSVSKSFGEKRVIRDFSHVFSRGERVGIIGPNGSGKTTFLNLVSGSLGIDAGSLSMGDNTVISYFSQDSSGMDGDLTVLEYIQEKAERVDMGEGSSLSAEQFLERFLFPRSMFAIKTSKLSGGERRRLQLIRLLVSGSNFLLLDEPTNDFDIYTVSLLEDFLIRFPGCVVAVSHDRAFLDRVTDGLFVFDGMGGVRGFAVAYSDYREIAEAERKSAGALKRNQDGGREGKKAAPGENGVKLSFKERKEFEALLGEIASLEAEKEELEASFSGTGGDYASSLKAQERYSEILSLIDAKTARWMELSEREASP